MIDINWNPPPKFLRHFAWMLSGILALAGVWCAYRFEDWRPAAVVLAAALMIGLIGWRSPSALRWLYVGWSCAAFPVAWVVSHLLLAGVYYLVITPIGLMLRLLGHDLLGLKIDRSAESYWTPRQTTEDRQRYFRQF
jgi:hypothetical protein